MKTIKNIFKNKELRNKILITIMILVIYKLGTMIKIPTVGALTNSFENSTWIVMMNYLSGSYLGKFTIFSLGLSPYITASIVIQLLGMGVVPAFTRWKDEGEAGHKKQEKATFIFALILALAEAFVLVWSFNHNYHVLKNNSIMIYLITVAILFIGALVTMFMARVITRKGIGNGSSLIIFAGIASRVGYDIYWSIIKNLNLTSGIKQALLTSGGLILYLLFYVAIIGFVVFIDKSIKNIHVQYAKQSNQFSSQTSNIPIKVNIAGVIPVIFTSSIMAGFAYTGVFTKIDIFSKLGNYQTPLGFICYIFLIMFFTTFYATEIFNAKTIAKNIKKSNAVVVGKLPGDETEKHIDGIIRDMSIIGGIALTLIAIFPIITTFIVDSNMNLSLGGTSMMIMAGVATETVEQIKAKIKTVKSTNLKLFE